MTALVSSLGEEERLKLTNLLCLTRGFLELPWNPAVDPLQQEDPYQMQLLNLGIQVLAQPTQNDKM